MTLVDALLEFVTNENLLVELLWRFCVLLLLASALDLAIGYTGLFQLGHVAFLALGALGTTFGTHPDYLGMDLFTGILLGFTFSTAAVMIVGIPTLRLRGDYFAIATLGLAQLVQVMLLGFYTQGIFGVPTINPAGCDLDCMMEALPFANTPFARRVLELVIVAAVAFGVHAILGRVKHSPFGRVLKSIREDRHAAAALGKDVELVRFKALWLSALVASLAGSLWVHHLRIMSPSGYGFQLMILVLVMIILGGLGAHQGALLGAIVVTFVDQEALAFTSWLGREFPALGATLDLPALRLVLFAALLLVLMLVRPSGLMGGRDLRFRDLWKRETWRRS